MAMRRLAALVFFLTAGLASPAAAADPPLTIVSSGPNGELASLALGNEIRIVFSEPMVKLGRIPQPVTAPSFHITPAVSGSFRWSGTTILIFTPGRPNVLPYATTFTVTIDTNATAISGRKLAAPHSFTFTTPTVRLQNASWERPGVDQPARLRLLFNQPVNPTDVLAHATFRFEKHEWKPPTLGPAALARMKAADPQALAAFNAKIATASAAAAAVAPVQVRAATVRERAPYLQPENVVLMTVTKIPPESTVRVTIDPTVPSPGGREVPGKPQTYTFEFEPTFFVEKTYCAAACDPDRGNPVTLRRPMTPRVFAKALTVTDITDRGGERVIRPSGAPAPDSPYGHTDSFTIEDAGYDSQPPARTFALRLDPSLQSDDGQRLGYAWTGVVENWHQRSFTSFGGEHGVWESSGGPVLPFYSRNLKDAVQWIAPLSPSNLMPAILSPTPPAGPGESRLLPVSPDTIVSPGLDVSKALTSGGTGLLWAAIKEGTPIARAKPAIANVTHRSIVQVTNLGISVKDSPLNTLVWVTRLDNAAPVAGATVSIVDRQNKVFWRGTTDKDGLALAPNTPLRRARYWERALEFIVVAEKDGDVAYVGSDWTEGTDPYQSQTRIDLDESIPQLRGSVFADRGVYKPGEEVHVKAILRSDTPTGMRLYDAGTSVDVKVFDPRNKVVDDRRVTLSAWSSAEWAFRVAGDAALGDYTIRLEHGSPDRTIRGSFLVAAYRRPDFRVDANLTSATTTAGTPLTGSVNARYLFGAAMVKRPVRWTYTRVPVYAPPATLTEHFTDQRFTFVGCCYPYKEREELGSDQATLTDHGLVSMNLETEADAGLPFRYTFEGEVEDISRQRIAGRASLVVHPAPYYIGVKESSDFVDVAKGFETEIVAVSPDGKIVPGVEVQVTVAQQQWYSARRAEGHGFYAWESQRSSTDSQTWTVTTGPKPVPLHIDIPSGGSFIVRAIGKGEGNQYTITQVPVFALGAGYTAWERFDDNHIELLPERRTYKAGDTARIMIESPWERATAIVTTEREGVRSYRQFLVTSTQQAVSIPLSEADIPNVYVSVLLVKGRTQAPEAVDPNRKPVVSERASDIEEEQAVVNDTSDPGKPAFRLGYVELKVDDVAKKLTVAVKANQVEYRPAQQAKIELNVKDRRGQAAMSEVTLWAVDYGVLSLTNYRTPNVLDSIWVDKALQVITTDNRERLISRRVMIPKGADEGGGGGAEAGPGTIRKDFRVLAFWVGSVVTDSKGHATTTITLPESLTTYRIMAVAGDKQSRFGASETEIRINKPVLLKAAYPRFLAVGDTAFFGSVVTSQLKKAGTAVVTIRSLDPAVLEIRGDARKTIDIAAGGSAEARFDAAGKTIGRARVQMTVRLGDEGDAFEDVIPVEILVSPETVAAHGEAKPEAREQIEMPAGVVSSFGGLHLEMASTAMVGLAGGAEYLVEYPYGCAEQRSSRTLALLLAADLGEAFRLPGIDPAHLKDTVQASVAELPKFQCPSGDFAFWAGQCEFTSPHLTSYVLHVLQRAKAMKYAVDDEVLTRGYGALNRQLSTTPPTNEAYRPWYNAWQAFAIKVLAEGGQNADSTLNRVYGYRDGMPVFGLAYLADALVARHENGARLDELKRRIGNAILPEAGASHVEEMDDPYLLWFWNSSVRSTAISLGTLVRVGGNDAVVPQLVRWLMAVRKNGRWGNTQENALAMEALVDYYRKYESETPQFTGTVTLGTAELARAAFQGRSAEAEVRDLPMTALAAQLPAGSTRDLTFKREGTGTLFYSARLRYAVDRLFQEGLDAGFSVTREYAVVDEYGKPKRSGTAFQPGELVKVTLKFELTKERRFVAVVDPLPAGLEPIESAFETTSEKSAEAQEQANDGRGWVEWWRRGGFDYSERHDDRVTFFATRLSEGRQEVSYLARATTAGSFRTAPTHVEEMYQPEVFGRTGTAVIEVKR